MHAGMLPGKLGGLEAGGCLEEGQTAQRQQGQPHRKLHYMRGFPRGAVKSRCRDSLSRGAVQGPWPMRSCWTAHHSLPWTTHPLNSVLETEGSPGPNIPSVRSCSEWHTHKIMVLSKNAANLQGGVEWGAGSSV